MNASPDDQFDFSRFADRLRWCRLRSGKSQVEVATAVGITQSAYSKLERTGSGSEKTGSLANYLGVNALWLESQIGERDAENKITEGETDLVIRQYDTGGAMGHGFALEEKPPGLIKSWSVDHEWLRLNVGHHTGVQNLCIVTGFGPSMKPRYNPGDPLLCDRGVTAVESDGIYFFRVGDHGFIKQLQRIPTERGLVIRAKSYNPDYDPFDITDKMDFQVFGKILTVWRSEQLE